MKKILISLMLYVICLSASAQSDVTKFLGIPIDGFKSEMREKLIAKGFEPKTFYGNECLEGEFNGTDVRLWIVTNNNKVYRIRVSDKNTVSEAEIKIRFNNLVRQFENNKRYVSFSDQIIPDNEMISYGMHIDKKYYDAVFYQETTWNHNDSVFADKFIHDEVLTEYTEEAWNNPTEEMLERRDTYMEMLRNKHRLKKTVWFRINERSYGDFYINMYYDNEYNQANGEDL